MFRALPPLVGLPSIVYILQSISDPARHYVGVTTDLSARLIGHNAGHSPHTAKHRPWAVLVSIEFANATKAAAFERYLKTGSGRAFSKRHF